MENMSGFRGGEQSLATYFPSNSCIYFLALSLGRSSTSPCAYGPPHAHLQPLCLSSVSASCHPLLALSSEVLIKIKAGGERTFPSL